MPIETRSNPLHSPIGAALALLGAIAIGAAIGLGIGLARSWTAEGLDPALIAAGLGAAAWLVGAIVGLALIVAVNSRDAARLSFAVLAASMVRMLVALSVGLLAFFVLEPEGRTFWTSFLMCGLLALMAETSWAMHTLKSGQAASRPDGAL